MTSEEAVEAVARARQQAEAAAGRDLARLRVQALQAGQARAERLFPTLHRPGRLNPRSSRILRGWYVEVYTAALRDRLGEQVSVPAVAEVDATATALRRALGSREPNTALRLVGVLHETAVDDAAATGASLHATLTGAAERRGAAYGAQLANTNPARTAILSHWYQRCYDAAVDTQLGVLQPLQSVTSGEARAVAASVEHGQFRRIIGADNVPLVTAHGTAMTDADRRLAAGEVGIMPAGAAVPRPNRVLRVEVTGSWNRKGRDGRAAWASGANLADVPLDAAWGRLPGIQQSALIRHWLDTHRDAYPPTREFDRDDRADVSEPPVYRAFAEEARLTAGSPETAAAAMFNQTPNPALTAEAAAVAASFPVPARGGHSAGAVSGDESRRPRAVRDRDARLQR